MPSLPVENILFFQTPPVLRNRTELKKFIRRLFTREGKRLESLNYIFCSDKELLKINQEYLAHDDYTDIITFQLSKPGQAIQGEIYISIDRIRDNAWKLKTPLTQELHRVIFHGALHLCGFQDKSSIDSAEMRSKEDEYLHRYF